VCPERGEQRGGLWAAPSSSARGRAKLIGDTNARLSFDKASKANADYRKSSRPACAPPRSSSTRPHDWALDLGPAWRPAPLASASALRLHHHPPSPTAQSHVGASSSASLVDRPLSTPTAPRGLGHAFRRGPRRYKTRSEQGGSAPLQRDSRCVLVLPTSSPWRPLHPRLAQASASRRLCYATMSLLEPLACRSISQSGRTGGSGGARAGGRPRAARLGPCASLLLSLLVP